jgi:hypothetical protein
MNPEIEFLVKLRDALLIGADAVNEYLETMASIKDEKKQAAVQEVSFTILKFEPQQGAKIGEFEVVYEPANLGDKWHHAYNILRNANATIKDRY